MKHSYHEVVADSNYSLGLQLGSLFKAELIKSLEKQVKKKDWQQRVKNAKKYLKVTNEYFPEYLEELKGYAKSAGVRFEELWTFSLDGDEEDKCTTLVTNEGKTLSHNEDWEVGTENRISLLKKTIRNLTIFEFFYHNTLGGNSISINSHGYVQAINTLSHKGSQIGVPRNVISRWLSETKNPEKDFEEMKKIPRQLGYNHVFISSKGSVWNIESTESKQVLIKSGSPYVHTNHYLSELKKYDVNENDTGTKERYEMAVKGVKPEMNIEEIVKLNSDISRGSKLSIFNERTIGRMMVDLKEKKAKVWLLKEKNRGWIDYSLDFIGR